MTEAAPASQPRIVVGIDGSDQSANALRWAAHMARIFAARLEAVIAWEFPASFGWATVPQDWDPAGEMRRVLDGVVQSTFGDEPPASLITRSKGRRPRQGAAGCQRGRDHAGGRQPRSRRLHRPAAGLGERERRRARHLPGPDHSRRSGTTRHNVESRRYRRYSRKSRSAALAAHIPHIPCTPPPGGVDPEHRYVPGSGTRYGSHRSAGLPMVWRSVLAPPAMSPPT